MGIEGVDLRGKRFGHLLVIEKVKLGYSLYRWRCVCDCGNETFVKTDHLISGGTKSCGCQHFEACKTHGMTNTRIYHIWCAMKARCLNPSNHKFKDYGGRWIKLCDEWMQFEPFAKWAMDNGYREDLSIDRKNNDGNYEPSNCRWITNKQQANNTRKTKKHIIDGKEYSAYELSLISGVPNRLIDSRIRKGWGILDAAFTPSGLYVGGFDKHKSVDVNACIEKLNNAERRTT